MRFTDAEADILAQKIVDLYLPVQEEYLTLIGKQLKEIGTLSPANIRRLKAMQTMRGNAREIAEELAAVSSRSIEEIERIFEMTAKEDYEFSKQFYTAQGLKQIPFAENAALKRIVYSEAKRTARTLYNLSQTTASQLKRNPTAYRTAVDTAVRAVTGGMSDYNTAIRRVVKQAASEGISVVQFDTGYRRRLDSQVRMNVLEGIRQVSIGINEAIGKEIGADGVEISVHGMCAPDHIDIQGRQFSLKGDVTVKGTRYPDYDTVNNSLARPIGTLNCKHYPMLIILGVSSPVHSAAELEKIRSQSEAETEIDGRTMTGYEWTQEHRRLETQIRKCKDTAVIAAASGDMTLRRQMQAKIDKYKEKYYTIADKTGISPREYRMAVSGYHYVKPDIK